VTTGVQRAGGWLDNNRLHHHGTREGGRVPLDGPSFLSAAQVNSVAPLPQANGRTSGLCGRMAPRRDTPDAWRVPG
jgi:hypothetical protein